jgi:hypothetical protein
VSSDTVVSGPELERHDASSPAPAARTRDIRSWSVPLGLTALLAVPLLIALVVLRHPRWYPLGDLAQTEMRVRAVASRHPPLIGLPGRLGQFGNQGSHPGPMSFWLLWPFYQLFGGQSWALEAASVSLHVIAMATALWIAFRRGGTRLVLGVALVLAVLTRAYGGAFLTQAWNPYLPLMAWIVVVLALWSVLVDDLVLLPVAVVAASFCMQTHLPYLGLSGGLVGLTAMFVLVRAYVRRIDDTGAVRRALTWTAIAVAVGIVVWIPPVIDELTRSPGNLTVVWRELTRTNPTEPPLGGAKGVSWLLAVLNPWRLAGRAVLTTSANASIVPGLVVLLAWIAAVAVTVRERRSSLLRYHAVVGAALVLAAFSLSRVHGYPWYYLALWGWGISGLMLLGIVWTGAMAAGRRVRAPRPRSASVAVNSVLLVAIVAVVALFSSEAVSTEVPVARYSNTLSKVAPPLVRALDRGSVPGGGHSGRYLVTWVDPISIGTQGYGLLDELDRRGFRVGALSVNRGGVPDYQILEPTKASAVVHLSVGPDIDVWDRKPGVVRVSYSDPRTVAQRSEYTRLSETVIADLRARGRPDLAANIDGNVFTAAIDTRIPERDRILLSRMARLGLPVAVFVGPPAAQT